MENTVRERKRRIRLRRFLRDEYHHIYQRTVNRFNLFYDLEDYLVYYTIFSIAARKYGVNVLGLCLMFDHVHMMLKAGSKVVMSEFIRQVTSMFAREQNTEVGRKGALFQARFGSAPKKGLKLLRTAIAYLFNNPVEKLLCSSAESYRWSFLPYAQSDHPFSDPIVMRQASSSLRRAIKEVDTAEAEDRHLRYGQLKRMLYKLNEKERMQLVDHIISIYKVIDYDALICCYGSYESMLMAINSNTGSEYEIKEDRYRFSDMEYVHMLDVLRKVEGMKTVRHVVTADVEEKKRLATLLRQTLQCSPKALSKFLHIDLSRADCVMH